jgi:hypothetical protein
MNYDQLTEILKTDLPMNRKERFFSATVLPSLLFHKDNSTLFNFLNEIPHFPSEVLELSAKPEFLFYTEYNLKESAGKKSSGIQISTDTRDTPDVIIEILKPLKVFVIIEAKMFLNLSQKTLDIQMELQRKAIIEKLEKQYQPCLTYHVALIPKQLGFSGTEKYDVIFWQIFTEKLARDLEDNYFFNYLKYALSKYRISVSDRSRSATTIQKQKSGLTIYTEYLEQEGKLGYWIGRENARKSIEEDPKSGSWIKRKYGINSNNPKDGRPGNWIHVTEFFDILNHYKQL